jgi:hypothetical protein
VLSLHQAGIAAPLLLEANVHHIDLLQHLGWHGGYNVTSPLG